MPIKYLKKTKWFIADENEIQRIVLHENEKGEFVTHLEIAALRRVSGGYFLSKHDAQANFYSREFELISRYEIEK